MDYMTAYRKWIEEFNVRPEIIRLLQENIGSKLLDISLGDDFLGLTTKVKVTKEKINTWDYIKLKSFCTAQETIHKIKSQHTEWDKISANHISDKDLIYKIYFKKTNSTQ